jgi:hypothetical protein
MRDLLSKIVTGSMVAGAALLVVACGSNEDATANNAAMNVEDTMTTGNDMTNVDAMDGAGANLGAMDSTANGTTADTTANTTETTTTTNTTTTNGM